MNAKKLTSTMEDYLETLFLLNKEKGPIRVKNIAKQLGVKMPTVTNMLKNLSEKGLIDYEKHEYLELTEKGLRIGRDVDKRHRVLRDFLSNVLKIDSETADHEACEMEHGMSKETLSRLTKFMEFIQTCPRAGSGWLDFFEEYYNNGLNPERCEEHMKEFNLEYKGKLIENSNIQ